MNFTISFNGDEEEGKIDGERKSFIISKKKEKESVMDEWDFDS